MTMLVTKYLLIQVEYERRFLELCDEGTASIESFTELLQLGVDPNIHDKVCYTHTCMHDNCITANEYGKSHSLNVMFASQN